MRTYPGAPSPLGVSMTPEGFNFAVFSENATGVELVLLSNEGEPRELHRVTLSECTDHVWHAVAPVAQPDQLYAYSVQGPFAPEQGHRFDREQLLLDPYAQLVVTRPWQGIPRPFGQVPSSADFAEWGRLWHEFSPRRRAPLSEHVLYETHVRGLSRLHPAVPKEERGTFAGAGHPEIVRHLVETGVTAVEFLPVQFSWPEGTLLSAGMTNYWGYNTINFFSPDPRFGRPASDARTLRHDFQRMVRAFQAAGIEVIIDVVYNHTAEGDHRGPTLSFRGIDNLVYYRLEPEDLATYENLSWCGNTIDVRHGRVLQLIADSLRWWVVVMGVDGFRFDLAGALARETVGFTRGSGFFDIALQDPILSTVRLIAEPWDPGPFGYQAGNFPPPWREWNGEYRDSVRRFWRGEAHAVPALAARLAGSADLYRHSGRGTSAGVNFITCHDGFTLADLVSYNEKHNEANREDNRDGSSDNHSWNCGVEGPTEDPQVLALRDRQMRNLLLTLMVSQGAPLLLGGDELGRTQKGNNNAYCHDNELSWYHWEAAHPTLGFTVRRLAQLRRAHGVLRRRSFLEGQNPRGERDVFWLHPAGHEMSNEHWHTPTVAAIGMFLPRQGLVDLMADGSLPKSASLLVLCNASPSALTFFLPPNLAAQNWTVLCDTAIDAEWHSAHLPDAGPGSLPARAATAPGRAGLPVQEHSAQVWALVE